jgi:membrane-associated phospholipid phosphatase
MRRKIGLALLVLLPATAAAQDAPAHHSLIPHAREVLLLAGVGALMPFDARISHSFQSSTLQDNQVLHSTASAFNSYGDPGSPIIAVAILGLGVVSGSEAMTDVGMHASEAIALSGTAAWFVKGMSGRLRPNVSPGDADQFKFAGGFSGNRAESFPSGHATVAFALATTISDEVRMRNHRLGRYVAPASYAAATMVALARVYSHKHWASDVVLGAAFGVYSSKLIFRHAHPKRAEAPK